MKHVIYILSFCAILFACTKQMEPIASTINSEALLNNVKQYLNKNLSASDSSSVDYSNLFVTKDAGCKPIYVRLAFKGKDIASDFILLQTDSLGNSNAGRIIHMARDIASLQQAAYSGSISIALLNRQPVVSSVITSGYVQAFHPAMQSGTQVNEEDEDIIPAPDPTYDELPEVVVVGYYGGGGGSGAGMSYADYLSLGSLMSGGGSSAHGTSPDGSASGGGGGAGSSGGASGTNYGIYSPAKPGVGGTGVQNDNPVSVYFETGLNAPAINVTDYLKGFATIPDAGSVCSVTIYTDLPVNGNPSIFFYPGSGAIGHVFLALTKTNSSQSITQNIGFYPVNGINGLISNTPVAAKFVDNQLHEYNASLNMVVSPAAFNAEISEIEELASYVKYSINTYNCADFSLQVINTIRGTSPLIIPKFDIPEFSIAGGSNTPEGLYILLANLKSSGGSEAAGITISYNKLYAGLSHGPF